MNRTVCKKIFVQIATIGLLVFASGCAPSIHDVVKTVSAVPVGANRDEIRKVLFESYSKLPKAIRYQYGPLMPAVKLTENQIRANRNFIDYYFKVGCFNYVYPADLFEKLSPGDYVDGISYLKESFGERHASVEIYYDPNNKYLGFTAVSDRKAKRK